MIRCSQHRSMKGRPRLTDAITFCDKVTHLVREGDTVDVGGLDFSKEFGVVSAVFSWRNTALARCPGHRVKNWLAGPK